MPSAATKSLSSCWSDHWDTMFLVITMQAMVRGKLRLSSSSTLCRMSCWRKRC